MNYHVYKDSTETWVFKDCLDILRINTADIIRYTK